ncbi:MAG: hypothetical protein GY947_22770 [Rhodobacteraceae bacterium]|nr:hypothetical protein [Paracoccaceae bacterium]
MTTPRCHVRIVWPGKVRNLGAACVLILSLGLVQAAPGHAGEYVTCVQKQLKALGYHPGPADGELRPLTTHALAQYRQKIGVILFAQPELSERTALTWCRVIGGSSEQTARLMPSHKAPIILTDDSEGDALMGAVTTAYETAEAFFRTGHDIHLASRMDVAASANAKNLAVYLAKLRRMRNEPVKHVKKVTANQCGSRLGIRAAALSNQIIFCLPSDQAVDQAWADKMQNVMNQTMVHEYTHHIQREYANAKLKSRPLGGARRYLGPNWMVEGGAEYFESQFHSPKQGSGAMLVFLRAQVASTNKRLGELRPHRSVSTSDDYGLALFATYLLAQRFGDESLFAYWREIGKGQQWEQAFKTTFGVSLMGFELKFQELRSSISAATAYMDGAD